MLRFHETAKQFITETRFEGRSNAFTFKELETANRGKTYIVADGKHEVKLSVDIDVEQLTNIVALYFTCFAFDEYADTINSRVEGETIYLYTGKLFSELDEAICFAKEHNEPSIYKYTNQELIEVF